MLQIHPNARTTPAVRAITLCGPSCLAVGRYWDQARWAIEAYAWRFDGLGRAPEAGGTA